MTDETTGTTSARIEAATVRQTVTQIRFALNQMSARNAQHEFEDLSRTLARETVSRNILPATGPVGAGGDQGRDFETFRSQLMTQVGPIGFEIGVAEGDGLAFACSLQAERIERKILADIEKINEGGTAVEFKVYYCEADVPVGRRHALQNSTRDTHGTHLEIFDGNAIAELLSQRHLYWIAQEYLHLPAAALPPGPDRPDWYEADLARWREGDRTPTTPRDLVDLSGCIRYATSHDDAVTDLPFWIERLAGFLRSESPASIAYKARYEIAVAQLRGLGDLRPVDELVTEYIDYALDQEDPATLTDASVLLMYCIGARGRRLTDHSEEQIRDWNSALQSQVLSVLGATQYPGRRCELLETLGWLRSQPDLIAARDEGVEYRLPSAVPRVSLDNVDEIIRDSLAEPVMLPVVDLGGAFDAWSEMVQTMPHAPLFPVEQLSKMFRISAHLLIQEPRYDDIVSALDRRVAEVAGGDAAAAIARDRAMTFYNHGRPLDALRDLHRARLGWFAGETRKGAMLASLMMSQIYRELNLPMAAKLAAIVATRLAVSGNRDYFSRACFQVAEADYHQGAWISSTMVAHLGIQAHILFTEDPHNWERHEHLMSVFFELSVVGGLAHGAGGPYQEYVDGLLADTSSDEVVEDLVNELEGRPWWEAMSVGEFADHCAQDLGHPAFADGGRRRTITWKALGATWMVEFENDYPSTLVGERLAAFAQVTLAELTGHDPELLPTTVVLEVERLEAADEVGVELRSDGRGGRWLVRLPTIGTGGVDAFKDVARETVSAVLTVVADTSVLPQDEFTDIIDAVFGDGLVDKLLLGTIYDDGYRELVSKELFESVDREEVRPIVGASQPIPREADELVPSGVGRHYDRGKSLELASGRYRNITSMLVATLPALRAHEPFMEVVANLRADGWKDWHILVAIFNIAQNHRVRIDRPPRSEAEAREYFKQATKPEEPGDPMPVSLFTETSLRDGIRFAYPATLKLWGLELRQNPVDIESLEMLLANRYAYWVDDTAHEDPFRCTD